MVLQKKVNAMIAMSHKPPRHNVKEREAEMTSDTKDSVSGLLSWTSRTPIKTFETAINLSYYSVLHNKDEGDDMHSYFKIFCKIIEEELLSRACDFTPFEETSKNAEDLRSNEFNRDIILAQILKP